MIILIALAAMWGLSILFTLFLFWRAECGDPRWVMDEPGEQVATCGLGHRVGEIDTR